MATPEKNGKSPRTTSAPEPDRVKEELRGLSPSETNCQAKCNCSPTESQALNSSRKVLVYTQLRESLKRHPCLTSLRLLVCGDHVAQLLRRPDCVAMAADTCQNVQAYFAGLDELNSVCGPLPGDDAALCVTDALGIENSLQASVPGDDKNWVCEILEKVGGCQYNVYRTEVNEESETASSGVSGETFPEGGKDGDSTSQHPSDESVTSGGQLIAINAQEFVRDQNLTGFSFSGDFPAIQCFCTPEEGLSGVAMEAVHVARILVAMRADTCVLVYHHSLEGHYRSLQLFVELILEEAAPAGHYFPELTWISRKCGSVVISGAGSFQTLSSYVEKRFCDIRTAMQARNAKESGSGSKRSEELKILSAAIRVEMLSVNALKTLRLLDATRGGPFFLYNMARLSTLFEEHRSRVQQGLYPQLPDLGAVDFSLLNQEELTLCRLFIISRPDVLRFGHQCSELKPVAHDGVIDTHVVTTFLAALCRKFSSYYGRVHVLNEGNERNLAAMHVRLHLLRGVYTIFRQASKLLSLKALDRM